VLRIFTVLTLTLAALQAEPRIHRVDPPVLQPGEPTTVFIFGERLYDKQRDLAVKFWTSQPAEFAILDLPASPEPHGAWFKITLDSKVQPGTLLEIRAWDETGISLPVTLLADDLPAAKNAQRHAVLEAASHLGPAPLGVGGVTNGAEPSFYWFEAEAGQQLLFEVWGERLRRDFDPVLTIVDSKGNQIAFVDDVEGRGADPWLVHKFERGGEFAIKLHDIQWRGEFPFWLRITDGLRVLPSDGDLRRTKSDFAVQKFLADEDDFLTIIPQTRSIGSPALLLSALHDPAGKVVARSGEADILEELMRYRVRESGEHELQIRDLLGRPNLAYLIKIRKDVAPFELTLEGKSRNRLAAPAAAEVKFKIRCRRFGFTEGEIALSLGEPFEDQKFVIEAKKNDVEVKLKMPEAKAGELFEFQIEGTAEIDGKRYTAVMQIEEEGVVSWKSNRMFAIVK
jgi:hypothetical protein